MPRPLVYPKKVMLRLRDEDHDRIGKVLKDDEVVATFIRDSALRETSRRERAAERKEAAPGKRAHGQ